MEDVALLLGEILQPRLLRRRVQETAHVRPVRARIHRICVQGKCSPIEPIDLKQCLELTAVAFAKLKKINLSSLINLYVNYGLNEQALEILIEHIDNVYQNMSSGGQRQSVSLRL